MPEKVDIRDFTVYHSKEINLKEWRVQLCVIGESHLIVIENRQRGIVLSEILACVPVNNNLHSIFNKRLCEFTTNNIEKKTDLFLYKFNFQKIKVTDSDFRGKIDSIMKMEGEKISYDFAAGEKDGITGYFEPVTLITANNTPNNLKWVSLHSYPKERLAIITETVLKNT